MFCLLRQQLLLFCLLFVCLYILTPNGYAIETGRPENPKEIAWHISAKAVTFDNKRNLYIAEEDVVITGGKTRIEADYIEFSNKTKQAFARGNVLLLSGEDYISCNSMDINLATQTGSITHGTLFIQKNNFFIKGETIQKLGKFTYSVDKGSITSCSGESPDWKITARDIKVTIEGYGTANHTILWAKEVPAVYSPFLVFPAQTKRQTGLLAPRITSSDRKGIEYEQPLFLALSRNTDATLYADHMSDRGTKIGSEFRYVLDNRSKGTLFFDFLEDEKTDDGTDATKDYRFSTTPQRTNSDRFWFRMKHDQELPHGFVARLDMDVASDEDYLHEFRDGFTGYDETQEYFERQFGRSLDGYYDKIRKNQMTVHKSWSTYLFTVDTVWYDNITARRQNTADTTLQTLPSFQFDAFVQQIGPSQFFYSLDSEYTSFYRKDTSSTLVNGQRADIYPKIFLPLKLGKFFNFEPSLGVRQTIWYTDQFTDINGSSDDFRTRQMVDLGAQLSTKITKIYAPHNPFADKIKHEIIPKLEYTFIPNTIQDDLPLFDDLDRIDEQNSITWSFISNVTAKKSWLSPRGNQITDYQNLAYFRLYQSYDIDKQRDGQTKPFSDIWLEAELFPIPYFILDMDISWSPYDTHFKTLNIGNTLKGNQGHSLRTEYRYTTNISESVYSRIEVGLTDELRAYYSIEKNLLKDKTIETRAGIGFEKSCWALNLYLSKSSSEQSIIFLINLHGIGEFGIK